MKDTLEYEILNYFIGMIREVVNIERAWSAVLLIVDDQIIVVSTYKTAWPHIWIWCVNQTDDKCREHTALGAKLGIVAVFLNSLWQLPLILFL